MKNTSRPLYIKKKSEKAERIDTFVNTILEMLDKYEIDTKTAE